MKKLNMMALSISSRKNLDRVQIELEDIYYLLSSFFMSIYLSIKKYASTFKYLLIFYIIISILMPPPAFAEDGNWFPSGDEDSCAIIYDSTKNTRLIFSININGGFSVHAFSKSWSIAENSKNRIDLIFSNGDKRYAPAADGIVVDDRSGFSTLSWNASFDAAFLKSIRNSTWVDVAVRGQRPIRVALEDGLGASSVLQRCTGRIFTDDVNVLSRSDWSMLKIGNKYVQRDSGRWSFNQFAPNSGWTIALISLDEKEVVHRMHYHFNGRMNGWVDIHQSRNGTCLRYWDNYKQCINVQPIFEE